MDWLVVKTSSGEKKTSLVIECKTAAQANGVMEEGLAIGAELHRCTLYNPACKQKQCFNCQQYGHHAIYCTNTQACGFCAAAHRTQDCKKDVPKNASCVKEPMRHGIIAASSRKKNWKELKEQKKKPRHATKFDLHQAQLKSVSIWLGVDCQYFKEFLIFHLYQPHV